MIGSYWGSSTKGKRGGKDLGQVNELGLARSRPREIRRVGIDREREHVLYD